jgi:hypothetical protein
MVVEENGDPSVNDPIDDGRWAPNRSLEAGNLLSGRHKYPRKPPKMTISEYEKRGKGCVVCADGHVETVAPILGHDEMNHNPTK